jgi:hypothetical protein
MEEKPTSSPLLKLFTVTPESWSYSVPIVKPPMNADPRRALPPRPGSAAASMPPKGALLLPAKPADDAVWRRRPPTMEEAGATEKAEHRAGMAEATSRSRGTASLPANILRRGVSMQSPWEWVVEEADDDYGLLSKNKNTYTDA